MRNRLMIWGIFGFIAATAALTGCGDAPSKNAAPTASALASAQPASAGAVQLSVVAASSKASWVMDAPFEKIFGELPAALSGELFVDPSDVTQSTGLLEADLTKLDLFQQRRKDENDEKSEFGERTRSDKQNEHARGWLELEKDKAFAKSQFSIKKLETETADVTKLSGPERKITGTLTGELLLHGRKAERKLKFEATFTFAGGKLTKLVVKTTEPLDVNLEQFDVRPHDVAGKTLLELAPKVARSAPVLLEFSAVPKKN